jgi:hypothetical protein
VVLAQLLLVSMGIAVGDENIPQSWYSLKFLRLRLAETQRGTRVRLGGISVLMTS